jgi:hypothetical protein
MALFGRKLSADYVGSAGQSGTKDQTSFQDARDRVLFD